MSDSGQELKVYLVYVIKEKFWYPQPFARRESAEKWAIGAHKEGDFKVEGFRVRG